MFQDFHDPFQVNRWPFEAQCPRTPSAIKSMSPLGSPGRQPQQPEQPESHGRTGKQIDRPRAQQVQDLAK